VNLVVVFCRVRSGTRAGWAGFALPVQRPSGHAATGLAGWHRDFSRCGFPRDHPL